jgi:azurin
MEIKVLGPGRARCKRFFAETESAAHCGRLVTLTQVEPIDDLAADGIMATPAPVIGGRVVAVGKVLGTGEVATVMVSAAAGGWA